jgi:hypothetical protein
MKKHTKISKVLIPVGQFMALFGFILLLGV